MSNEKTILLYGVDADLFKTCFGKDEEWSPCSLMSLSEDCSAADLQSALSQEGLCCVVIMDTEQLPALQDYYNKDSGFVVFFGIYGEFDVPGQLNPKWRFSAYTKHDYELTAVGKHFLGDTLTKQQYTKCNLVSAPEEDRIMLPVILPFEKYLSESEGIPEEHINDPEYEEDVEEAKKYYPRHVENLSNQSPLVMHRNENGGRIAYLGFVNGDGNVPKIVRALLSGTYAA